MNLPIQQLKRGQCGQLVRITGFYDSVHRLGEVGLYRGKYVKIVQPGTPCILVSGGQKLAYRDEETELIVRVMNETKI